MDETLLQVGLPVKCRKCDTKGFVKPDKKYGGWYKSRLFRTKRLRWYCPEHHDIGKSVDDKFFKTVDNQPREEVDQQASVEEELYKLLD